MLDVSTGLTQDLFLFGLALIGTALIRWGAIRWVNGRSSSWTGSIIHWEE